MSRHALIIVMSAVVTTAGCCALGDLMGPKIATVTVIVPAGLLVGDSATASFNALSDDGESHNGRPVTWSSNDPAALSIDAQGKMLARIAGRTVTISAEVGGTTGSADVAVASDDSRFAFALADQPTAVGTYLPAAETRYNSSGGTIQVTHNGTGSYSVLFAGLGRRPGQRDNVQVSAYNATTAVICKPGLWDASGADLRVSVFCVEPNSTPIDSPFTIMTLGARAFGRTGRVAFALSLGDTTTVVLDSSATARNSSGGQVVVGFVEEGSYAAQFSGLESAWLAGPVAIELTAVGGGGRRCRVIAVDPSVAGFGMSCTRSGGGPVNSAFSLLWLQQGRPSMRFGFAWAQNPSTTTDYSPDPAYLINSSGGTVRARKTAAGKYRVVFAGLGRPAGQTETVLVTPLLGQDRFCNIAAWGNTGASDLFVDVACFAQSGTTPADAQFSVLVAQ